MGYPHPSPARRVVGGLFIQVEIKMSNPTGKGGLQDRPQHINRKGRPKSFDKLRALAVQLSHEEITDKKTGDTLTVVEAVLRTLAKENPVKFLEIAYGKVPDRVEHTGEDGKAIKIKVTLKNDD